MTDHTRITFDMTRAEQDAVQYAIARRREQIAECIGTCESTGQRFTADAYREEDATLARCQRLMARAVGKQAIAEINALNSEALRRSDMPAWMDGLPTELD